MKMGRRVPVSKPALCEPMWEVVCDNLQIEPPNVDAFYRLTGAFPEWGLLMQQHILRGYFQSWGDE